MRTLKPNTFDSSSFGKFIYSNLDFIAFNGSGPVMGHLLKLIPCFIRSIPTGNFPLFQA